MIGFSAERKDIYNFIVFENYINLKAVRQVNAEVPSKSEVTLNAFVRIRDKNFLVYSQYTKSSKQTTVYVNEMSSSNVLLGTPIKVLTVDKEKNKIYGDVRVNASKNKKSILIYQATEGNGKDPRKMTCSVVDENFSVVWQNDFDFKMPEKEADLKSVDIDDDGNLYALLYKGKEKYQKASVFSYNWKIKNFAETVVGNPAEKAKTYGCLLEVVDGISPVVAGVSLADDDLSYFVVSFDAVKNTSRELQSAKFAEKDKALLVTKKYPEEGLAVQHILKTANNNFVVSFEVNHVITLYKQTSSSSDFYSGSVFVVSVGANGVAWSNVVYKRQTVPVNPFTTSHSLIISGDNVLIFYNDKESNLAERADESDGKVYRGSSSALVLRKINSKGEMTSQKIETGQPDNFGINPRYFVKISDTLYHTQLFATTFSKFACAYATIELN